MNDVSASVCRSVERAIREEIRFDKLQSFRGSLQCLQRGDVLLLLSRPDGTPDSITLRELLNDVRRRNRLLR